MAMEFAQGHRRFLQENNPRLLDQLIRSGDLESYLQEVGEQAEEMFDLEMSREQDRTKDLPFNQRVERLRNLQQSMMELIRHDLIYQPLPDDAQTLQIDDCAEPRSTRDEFAISQRYEELIKQLCVVEERRKAEDIPPLKASLMALKVAITFLLQDRNAKQRGAHKSLMVAAAAIHDHLRGVSLPTSAELKEGAPTQTMGAVWRAQIVVAYEILRHAKMKREEAPKLIADLLRRRNIRIHKGNNRNESSIITRRQVERWFYEKSNQQISGFAEAYAVMIKNKPRSSWPTDLIGAKRLAAHLVAQLEGVA
jgi:hypothetical protein